MRRWREELKAKCILVFKSCSGGVYDLALRKVRPDCIQLRFCKLHLGFLELHRYFAPVLSTLPSGVSNRKHKGLLPDAARTPH
jgi:hypothetical protein